MNRELEALKAESTSVDLPVKDGDDGGMSFKKESGMNDSEPKKYKEDRYGRRSGRDRRVKTVDAYSPERRSGRERRSGEDRRIRFLGRL